MVIIDNVVGEIIEIFTKSSAIKFAEARVKYHNSEFAYKHQGKHYNAHAVMTINNNTITIDYDKEDK